MDSLEVLQAYLPALNAAVEDGNQQAAEWLLGRIWRELQGADDLEEPSEDDIPEHMRELLS